MKGLALPIRAVGGKLETCEDEEQLKKVIMLNLSVCASGNPFQNLGIGQEMLFSIPGPAVQNLISGKISRLFQRLESEQRARLSRGFPVFAMDPATQQLQVEVRYVNIKTTAESDLVLNYRLDAGGGA